LAGVLAPASFRLVHLDGSHAYADVAADIDLAVSLLAPGGVVVLDDYRAPHTPGVALATWEAVSEMSLRAICLSEGKLYAARPADPIVGELQEALRADASLEAEDHVLGELGTVVRVWSRDASGHAVRPDARQRAADRPLVDRAWAKARAVASRTRWRIQRRIRHR
jgi:hypothetical protein